MIKSILSAVIPAFCSASFAAFIAKSATNNLKANSNVSSFNNFKQTKMDSQLEEMEQLFLREVNN